MLKDHLVQGYFLTSQSPGTDALLTLYGGKLMLGGINGHLVKETTDENTERVSAVRQLSLAYLQSSLGLNKTAWPRALEAFAAHIKATGQLTVKST